MKQILFYFVLSCVMVSCGSTKVSTGPSGGIGPLEVGLHLNSDGELEAETTISIPIVANKDMGAGINWDITFTRVLNEAQNMDHYLIVLWDENGSTKKKEFPIGQPFEINFEYDQWVRKIKHLDNGTIIVFVEKQELAQAEQPTLEKQQTTQGEQPAEVAPPAEIPQVSIIGGDNVIAYFDSAKALGELAEEKYSLAERNKVNQTLNFTITLNSSRPVIWRWYWCATKKNILNQNMQAINVEFILNGENISNQFNSRYFPFTEDPMKGWTCFTYEAVLTDWDSGTYYLEQNTTIAQPINDGEEDFSDGYKIYKYTIYVQ